jgi:putative DNA primase/helicase
MDERTGMFDPIPAGRINGNYRSGWRPIMPVPDNAPLRIPRHPLGEPSAVWKYRDAAGRLLGSVCRWEHGDGKKTIMPLSYCQDDAGCQSWRWVHLPAPRPLYGLDRLALDPGAPVLLVEGEETADAAAKLFPDHVAVTSSGGSDAAGKADWSPLLGRHVVIWPDNDEPGRRYAVDAARLAREAGAASVRVVEVPVTWPCGWDLADVAPEGVPVETLSGMIDRAVTVTEPGSQKSKTHTSSTGKASQTDRLIALADELHLFHGADGTGYADFFNTGHRETWPIRSNGCRDWLRRAYYESEDSAPNGESLKSAIETLDARARFDGVRHDVFLRIGRLGDRIYLDLADAQWGAVEIGPDGWRIVSEPPVRFRRAPGMLPLPVPQKGGSLEVLRRILNVGSARDFTLAVAWLLAAFRQIGPYPVLTLAGEQGSAKSTFSAILRALVDPNDCPLRSLPREDRDLFIAASNSHLLVFDNVSGLPVWLADSLCRLATGGGFAVRQLFSDNAEVRFNGQRPIILNGIEDASGRPDLADRTIFLTLKAIPDEKRKTERELWTTFGQERPRILGALLDAVAQGLRRLPGIKLERLPRMADFALWGTACELEPGAFMTAYDENREDATALIVEHDAVAQAVLGLARDRTRWTGTATELLDVLVEFSSDTTRRTKDWPQTPRGLSGRLRRIATVLRKSEVRVEFDQRNSDKSRSRLLCIEWVKPPADKWRDFASGPSGSSEVTRNQDGVAGRSEGPMASPSSDTPADRTHKQQPDGGVAQPSDRKP